MKHLDDSLRPVVVIAGPTASGKSQLAMDLAQRFDITIVCADARQAIRGMTIGTAAPTEYEMAEVPHVGYAIRDPEQDYTAADFAATTRLLIDTIPAERLPVIVGGSGLYLQALLDGFSVDVVATPTDVRESVQLMHDTLGREGFYQHLVTIDPIAAARYRDMNPRRVQRALEYYYSSGSCLSSTWDKPRNPAPYTAAWIGVDQDDAELRLRIVQRCEQMWNRGLMEETQALLDRGIDPSSHILRTIGYAQALDVITERQTMSKAREQLIHATWQYAKRQRTWFRRDSRYAWITGDRSALSTRGFDVICNNGTVGCS